MTDPDDDLPSIDLPDELVRAMDLEPGEEGYEEAFARGLTRSAPHTYRADAQGRDQKGQFASGGGAIETIKKLAHQAGKNWVNQEKGLVGGAARGAIFGGLPGAVVGAALGGAGSMTESGEETAAVLHAHLPATTSPTGQLAEQGVRNLKNITEGLLKGGAEHYGTLGTVTGAAIGGTRATIKAAKETRATIKRVRGKKKP